MHVVAGKTEMRGEESTNVVSEEETRFRQPGKSVDIDENTNMTNTSHHASRNAVSPLRTANL